MLRPLFLTALAGLAACSTPQRLDLHAAGGAVTFAEGEEITREQAAAVVADVQQLTASPAYRAGIMAMAAQHAEQWKAEHPDAWQRIEISWHIDVIGPSDDRAGYAEFRATSSPASWIDPDLNFLSDVKDGVLSMYLEAETLLSSYPQPQHSLALVPQAALLAHGETSLSAHFSRPLLHAIRNTQLEYIRQVCAERNYKLFK